MQVDRLGVRMAVTAPVFELQVIASGLEDGYWIQAADINGDGRPDLVVSGVAEGQLSWYENPSWTRHDIARLHRPVSLDTVDLTGDGTQDIIVCHDYGETLRACDPEGGLVSWLRNPGGIERADGEWTRHEIGQLCSVHRVLAVRLGYDRKPYVLAAPMVGPSGGPGAVKEHVRITAYGKPDDPTGPWRARIVDDRSYSVVHELVPARRTRSAEGQPFLVASAEGVTKLAYDMDDDEWRATPIGPGERSQVDRTGFQGANSTSLGELRSTGSQYIASLEPFHGNTVVAYTPQGGNGWRRTVLDVFGDPNELGEGPGHDLVCADFDGDGDDEFLVALRGPEPWQGVFYYKAVDAAQGLWTKKRVSTESAARIAVADFDGDGMLDFATIGYYTPGYFLADDPKIVVAYNRTPQR